MHLNVSFLSMSSFLKLLDLLCSHRFHSVRVMFFELKLYTRRVPDTRLKPGGYEYRYEFLPVSMSISMNFYPQPLCWWAGNYSIRPEPDPLPTLYTHTTTPALAVRGLQSTKPLPRGVTLTTSSGRWNLEPVGNRHPWITIL
jgi:hypothetical protein